MRYSTAATFLRWTLSAKAETPFPTPAPSEDAHCDFTYHSGLLSAPEPALAFLRMRTTTPPSSKETSSISVCMR